MCLTRCVDRNAFSPTDSCGTESLPWDRHRRCRLRDGTRVLLLFAITLFLALLDAAIEVSIGAYRRAAKYGDIPTWKRTMRYISLGWTEPAPASLSMPHVLIIAAVWINVVSGAPALFRFTRMDYLLKHWTQSAAVVAAAATVKADADKAQAQLK